MIGKVKDAMKRLDIPTIAVISDHQASIRIGVKKALPGVKRQFCHFHVLRNALKPIIDRDRRMKKNIRKRIRGISRIESSVLDRDDPQASIIGAPAPFSGVFSYIPEQRLLISQE